MLTDGKPYCAHHHRMAIEEGFVTTAQQEVLLIVLGPSALYLA